MYKFVNRYIIIYLTNPKETSEVNRPYLYKNNRYSSLNAMTYTIPGEYFTKFVESSTVWFCTIVFIYIVNSNLACLKTVNTMTRQQDIFYRVLIQ